MSFSLPHVPRRAIAALGALVMAAAVVVVAPYAPANESDSPETGRFAGDNRFDTAAQLALDAYPSGASEVIVATGFNFPDALAASGLAGLVDGPTLLVNDELDSVPDETATALETLDPDTVHVAGSDAAVSTTIYDALAEAGSWEMNRTGGVDRFETAALMADEFSPSDVADGTAIVATGYAAADALAAGPLAHDGPHPVLLTNTDELPEATATALADLEVDSVLVLGSTDAVSQTVADDIAEVEGVDTVTRAAGSDRFETAVEIAKETGFSSGEALLVSGYGKDDVPADALAGAAYGAKQEAVMLPVNDVLGELPAAIGDYLAANAGALADITTLGGESAVPGDVEAGAQQAATPEAPVTNQAFSVEPAGDEVLPTADPDTGEREFTVDASDVDEVSIALVDADEVTVEEDVVSFDDVDADGDVNFVTAADITDVATDGAVVPGTSAQVDGVPGGEITFTVQSSGTDASQQPVIFVAGESDNLPTDEGLPENDFGVGGLTVFADVAALDAEPEGGATDEADFVQVPEGATVEHVVSLVDASDEVVPADGQTIEYRIVDAADSAFDPADVAGTTPEDYDALTSDQIAFAGDADTSDGETDFTYDGSTAEEGDHWLVFNRWQGNDAYDGAAAQELEADDVVVIEWVTSNPEPAGLEFSEDEAFSSVGSSHTVDVQVVDQFGDPLAPGSDDEWEVEFTVSAPSDFTQPAGVTADGSASMNYVGPADSVAESIDADLLDASEDPAVAVEDPAGDAIGADTAAKYWYEVADGVDVDKDDEAVVVDADDDNTLLFVEVGAGAGNFDADRVVAFDWSEADLFEVGDSAATQSEFSEALADVLDPDETPDEDGLETRNYEQDGTTVFNLYDIP